MKPVDEKFGHLRLTGEPLPFAVLSTCISVFFDVLEWVLLADW